MCVLAHTYYDLKASAIYIYQGFRLIVILKIIPPWVMRQGTGEGKGLGEGNGNKTKISLKWEISGAGWKRD